MSSEHPSASEETLDSSRRDFIKTVGVAGLSGGTAGVVGLAGLLSPAEVAQAGTACPGDTPDEARLDLGGTPIYDAATDDPGCDEGVLPPLKARVLALKQLILDKKLLGDNGQASIDNFVDYYEHKVGPQFGKAVIARAWIDPAFKDALLNPEHPNFEPYKSSDKRGPFAATWFIRDFLDQASSMHHVPPIDGDWLAPTQLLGYTIGPEGEWLRVVANGKVNSSAPFVHNLVSCTLCSCYPQALLGVQPVWYKSRQYRARSVTAPRGILREFAAERGGAYPSLLEAYIALVDEVRVWDSNSEVRFLVIPEPPADAVVTGIVKDSPDEVALRNRVTRNAMIGAEILYPASP
jgi:nitrile hydratase subunit alpha